MQLYRRHSTRDFFGTTFFGPVVFGVFLIPAIILWAKGQIPISSDEPLSLLGAAIILILCIATIIVAIQKYRSPWFVHIQCTDADCTLIGRNPKHTLVIKKSTIVSATVQSRQSPHGGGSVGAIITYTQNGKQQTICIRGDGSWRDESGAVLRQKKFCEALVSMLTS